MHTAIKPVLPLPRTKTDAPVTLVRKTSSQMRCPFCGAAEMSVKDSRLTSGNTIRRRRVCLSCEERFTTFEVAAELFYQLNVIDTALTVLRDVDQKVNSAIESLQRISLQQGGGDE